MKKPAKKIKEMKRMRMMTTKRWNLIWTNKRDWSSWSSFRMKMVRLSSMRRFMMKMTNPKIKV